MSGSPATHDQRATAARLLAEGSGVAATARAIGVGTRTVQRWRNSDAAFAAMIERAERAAETRAYDADRGRARRAGLPIPTSPTAVREQRAEMERVLAQPRAGAFRPLPPTDDEVCDWIEQQQPATEMDYLDLQDARRGVVSRRARLRCEGRYVEHVPQFRIIPIDTPASLLAASQSSPDTRDPFAGMYGGSDAR